MIVCNGERDKRAWLAIAPDGDFDGARVQSGSKGRYTVRIDHGRPQGRLATRSSQGNSSPPMMQWTRACSDPASAHSPRARPRGKVRARFCSAMRPVPATLVPVTAVHPTRYLNGRALATASRTAGGTAQYVARSVSTPPDDERHERRRRAMLASLAVDPQPWRDASKVGEGGDGGGGRPAPRQSIAPSHRPESTRPSCPAGCVPLHREAVPEFHPALQPQARQGSARR